MTQYQPQPDQPQPDQPQPDQPQPDQPQPEYQPPYPPQPGYGSPVAEDPGRTLGIVGLILAFFVSVIGLIISIVARRKSKAAGFKNQIALAGIIVGIITTITTLIVVAVSVASIAALANKCNDLGPGSHIVNGVTYTCP